MALLVFFWYVTYIDLLKECKECGFLFIREIGQFYATILYLLSPCFNLGQHTHEAAN